MVADNTMLGAGGLLTLDEDDYEPPKSRVGSTSSVLERIAEMRQNEGTRSKKRAKIQGLIDGNRPYNQATLDNNGQGDRTNLNLREGEGMADAAKTPYYSLIFRVQRFANLLCDYGDQPQRRMEWSEKMSAGFHAMLDGWRGHDFNVQLKQWQMVVFGCGLAVWEDAENPFWKARKVGEVLVPDGTEADIEQLEECAIPRKLSAVDLYQLVASEKAAKTAGWFPDRVKAAIIKAAPEKVRERNGDLWSEEYQSSLRRGDVAWNGAKSRIAIVDYLVKEFDGTVTHCIVLDDGGVSNSLNNDEDERLLFKKQGRFKSFMEVVCPFFFDIGTGEWHSVKGLGPKIYDFAEVSNRLTGDMIDGARNGAALLMSAADANALQVSQLVNFGPGVRVIPPGLTVQQNRIADSLQGPLAIKRDLQNTLQSNVGMYRQRVSAENQEPTLGQAQLNYQTQGQLNEAAVDRYMKTLDQLYLEMVRRTLACGKKLYSRYGDKNNDSLPWWKQLVLKFYQDCIADGVPEEALDFKNICSVKAVRGVGNGSPVSSEIATRAVMDLIPMMDERGRRHALRIRTAFLVGQGNVDAFFPPFDEQQLPDDHVALATLENNMLRLPDGDVIVTPRQDHSIHFQVHFSDAMEDVQALKQGAGREPMAVLIHLHKAGPHMREHLDLMSGDPTRQQQIAPMQEGWLMLSKLADQLQQQIEEAMAAEQEQQPQLDPKLVAALAKVQGELEIKRAKMEGDMQLKADKQEFTQRIKDLSTAHSIRLKDRNQASEMMRKLSDAPVPQGATA